MENFNSRSWYGKSFIFSLLCMLWCMLFGYSRLEPKTQDVPEYKTPVSYAFNQADLYLASRVNDLANYRDNGAAFRSTNCKTSL